MRNLTVELGLSVSVLAIALISNAPLIAAEPGVASSQTPVAKQIAAGGKVPPFGSFSTSSGQVNYRSTPLHASAACEAIASVVPGATKVSARLVEAAGDEPEHCRVEGKLPTDIGFQVNLPTAWNGRLYMYGNGGYAGEDPDFWVYKYLRGRALAGGFMTAWTDTGHHASEQPGATFARNPTALTNLAYQAVHATVDYAKKVASAFYSSAPKYSYWDGCSQGGREGVMEAYRFPRDFNGILAGAPTIDWTSIMISGLWRQSVSQGVGLTLGKLQTVFNRTIAACDEIDGVKDGLIDNPRRCALNVHRDVPRCAVGEDSDACLTQKQADALQKIYDGPPKVAGMPQWVHEYPGAEDRTTAVNWLLTPDGSPNTLATMADSWMKYISFKDPTYDSSKFDFTRDPPRARGADAEMNPKPDLKSFHAAGGKMITYWGWSDMALNVGMGIDFYDRVVAKYGLAETQQFYRLFLLPGVAHCMGGYGPNVTDGMTVLIDWVEQGVVPDRLPAHRIVDGKTIYNRAYCAYPASTHYRGSDPEVPTNYSCEAPPK